MKGMESMLASMLGVDPAELRAQVENGIGDAKNFAIALQAQMARIEQNQILLYQLLVDAGVISTLEDMRARHAPRLEVAEHVERNTG
jgi:hypothetical protein